MTPTSIHVFSGSCFLSAYHFLIRDSVVGLAIRYGLDGPGIDSLWGRLDWF
jgi:hypothetical protein